MKTIYERNPDSGSIRSRESEDYGNEQEVGTTESEKDMILDQYDCIYPPDDGVCEGEYVRPTQDEIISFNREENKRKEMEVDDTRIKDIYYYMDLLEKLKDFDYWKEWKHR